MKRSTFENYVIERCMDLAQKPNPHSYDRCRHACLLTYKDAILAEGVNSNCKHDFMFKYDLNKAVHAEAIAIFRALKHHSRVIHKCELWVCRNNENAHQSRPCDVCQKIIKQFGIKTIHYTDVDGNWCEEELA